jgi:8-oxo-dGTP pyrophosphatase MutT (NUDIX family)
VRTRLFWFISRTAIFLYRNFPIFGAIPGSVAIIRRDGGYLVIQRNDGYGLGLPGGVARPFERAEDALRREVLEETGLTVTSAELKLVFETSLLYPTRTSVFEARAEGEPRGSWEGRVVSVSLAELERNLMKTQLPVVEYLKRTNNQ